MGWYRFICNWYWNGAYVYNIYCGYTESCKLASNMFMRMIGSSLGAALLGGILNAQLNGYLQKEGEQIDQTITADSANTILDSATTSAMSQETLDILENGLSYSLDRKSTCLNSS